jgi:hypothetical protein
MILTVINEEISKTATGLGFFLFEVYTIPCHDRVNISVMLVLQSCTDPLHILPGSSTDTYATSSDCAYHIGNVKDEDNLDMQEVVGEVNVKTEKGIDSEEEECRGIKDEEVICSEEEGEEEDVNTKEEEEDVDIKKEVCLEGTV